MGSFINKSQLFAKYIIDYYFITNEEQYPIVTHQIG